MQVAALPAQPALSAGYAEVTEAAYLDEEPGQRATAARILERLEQHRRPGRLLDVGCWVGFMVAVAGGRGWAASGLEPSVFASAYARDRRGLDVQTACLDTAELDIGAFDAVMMGDVIEHLPDPGQALERIHALLAPGGVLCLALPDAGSRVARLMGSRWWSVLPTHVQYFTRSSVRRLLARRGFAVERIETSPKAFTVRYYLERLEGYSPPVAKAAVARAERLGVAERLVWPDFRDRMLVIARRSTI
jgi:SAM-dependent methyltransferase